MKHKLRLDALMVDSFPTETDASKERGTVRGNDVETRMLTCGSCYLVTCADSCASCPITCQNTCPFSCPTPCQTLG